MEFKKFLFKLLIFLTPFIFIIIFYVVKDPFKTIHSYESYYTDNAIQGVILNRDFVSFETFEKNNLSYNFDSFIFGNSRSIFYKKDIWGKYISENSEIYHFDASGESLFGIESKLRYLDKKDVKIKNALLVIDQSVLNNTEDSKGFLLMKHYSLSGKNRLSFELEFLKAFLNFKFISSYLYFQITNKVEPFMKDLSVLDDRPMNYDLRSNEIAFGEIDSLIKTSPNKYFSKEKLSIFYKRGIIQKYAEPTLNGVSVEMLQSISKIFRKHNTNFKIIISPLYDQVKIAPADLNILNKIFERENVFDFSGINQYTSDFHNYYETSHYRPIIAEKILEKIY